MARTLSHTPMAADKAGRWMGYIHGVGTARGWWRSQWGNPSSHQGHAHAPLGDPDVLAHHEVLRDLAARLPLEGSEARARAAEDDAWPMDARRAAVAALIERALATRALVPLAALTGLVQGIAAARGWIDVEAERARTRPLFHAAALAAGRGRPDTVDARGEGAPTTPTATPTAPARHNTGPHAAPAAGESTRSHPQASAPTGRTVFPTGAPTTRAEPPAFPFVQVDKVAQAWGTAPSHVMAWLGVGVEDATLLAPPALADTVQRLDGALHLARAHARLGARADWQAFLSTAVPGMGGHSFARMIDDHRAKEAVATLEAIMAGVHA